MWLATLIAGALAANQASVEACPNQPEPAVLASASFGVPTTGEALMFSAAPSFQRSRYAVKITMTDGAPAAWVTLVRLELMFHCNIHERTGEWTFELSSEEAARAFKAVSDLDELDEVPPEIVMDGVTIELQRYSAGQPDFAYSSNGKASEQVSRVILDMLKQHVPSDVLPSSVDWQYDRQHSSE
jgi:hypothetical protein